MVVNTLDTKMIDALASHRIQGYSTDHLRLIYHILIVINFNKQFFMLIFNVIFSFIKYEHFRKEILNSYSFVNSFPSSKIYLEKFSIIS